MRPFYYSSTTNFGDHMNGWLWKELEPDLLVGDQPRLIGVGSLLSRNLDLVQGDKVVFGTGSGYSSLPTPEQAANWKIYCVRGPLTAKHLGLPADKAITDAAWLINRLPKYNTLTESRDKVVFVPHWTSSTYGNWGPQCARMGIEFVDPFWPAARVFHAIANAKLAIVESLHGAIMADYYRTPWIAVASKKRVLKYKWLDWCASLHVPYLPFVLPPSDYLDAKIQGVPMDVPKTGAQPIEVAADTFDVPQSAPPAQKPTAVYRAKIRAKSVVRPLRTTVFKTLALARNTAPVRWAQKHHTDALAVYFEALQTQDAQLSDSDVHRDRIDMLNAAFDRMVADMRAGQLIGH